MLKELYIENLAVIEKMTVNLELGLTVFTGETGAGKSILIDGINLVLGQRSNGGNNRDIVRTGAKKAVVTAVFSELGQEVREKLQEFGYEPENGEILLTREISSDGKSVARLMGRPVTVGILKELGSSLITIHGQHDNQILLSADKHIDILDLFGGHQGLLNQYHQAYSRYQALKTQYRKILTDEQVKARNMDLLTYQAQEIEDARLAVGEDEEIEERLNVIRNSAKVSQCLSDAYTALYGQEDGTGAYDLLQNAQGAVEEVEDLNQNLKEINGQLESVKYEMEDAIEKISGFLDRFEFHPEELEQLEQRMEEIRSLKRKYGATVEEILAFGEQAKSQLKEIELSDQMQAELAQKINAQKQVVMELGKQLSKSRQVAAKAFSEQVAEELRFLDMPNVLLRVHQEKVKYGPKGCDEIEFLFSTNKGEELKSISRIASGGELSRIMLAIKSVLAEKDEIGTLIFDEVDTGVSGKSAQKIGLKLKSVAKNRQVLCVTHSAQIAALAHQQYLIQKQVEGERTFTRVRLLDEPGRVEEIARIMATDKVTDLMRQNAWEMLQDGKKQG